MLNSIKVVLVANLFVAVTAFAGTVVPAEFENVAGSGATQVPLFTPPDVIPRYQQVYAASELVSLIGQDITAMAFRLDENSGDQFPGAVYSDLRIRLSTTSRAVDDLLLDLDQNVGADEVEVFGGSFPLGALEGDASPNPFDFVIPFDTPFQYGGGNLLMEINIIGAAILSSTLDGADSNSDSVSRAYMVNGGTTSDSEGVITEFIVPEPSTAALLAIGAVAFGDRRRQR